jgi:hypothetical protein
MDLAIFLISPLLGSVGFIVGMFITGRKGKMLQLFSLALGTLGAVAGLLLPTITT